jgi:hypothetical protein
MPFTDAPCRLALGDPIALIVGPAHSSSCAASDRCPAAEPFRSNWQGGDGKVATYGKDGEDSMAVGVCDGARGMLTDSPGTGSALSGARQEAAAQQRL